MSMQREDKIHRIVAEVLAKDFSDVKILAINISEDIDEDGDQLINVNVVFEGTKRTLDAAKVSGLTRSVLPKLAEVKEFGFPIFSFISKADLGKLSPEAA
jgi:hypothetical protein